MVEKYLISIYIQHIDVLIDTFNIYKVNNSRLTI
jgi:hypothetical protein